MPTLKNRTKFYLLLFGLGIFSILLFYFSTPTSKIEAPPPVPIPIPSPKVLNKYESVVYQDPSSNFEISYLPPEDQYIITVYGSPFLQYRQEAEQSFIKIYRLTIAEACSKKVTIGTPFYSNPQEAGKIYKLSFCP